MFFPFLNEAHVTSASFKIEQPAIGSHLFEIVEALQGNPVKAPAAKKKQGPPGVTAEKGGRRASHEEPERGTNGGDGEPPKGASSKVAAPLQAEGKKQSYGAAAVLATYDAAGVNFPKGTEAADVCK